MIRPVFLDTSGWAAVLIPRDQNHPAAAEFYLMTQHKGQPFLTTNLVLAELHALVGRRMGDVVALRLLDQLRTDATHQLVWSTAELEREAVDRWLRPRLGRGISLADAVSFEIMRREGIRTVFTFDGDFATAGFEVVP